MKRTPLSLISIVLIAFFLNSLGPIPNVQAQDVLSFLPKPGVMISLSPEFVPAQLQGLVIHPDNALKFDFLIKRGDQALSDDEKKEEYNKLVKYFLASLTIPDQDQWVNLSPYEKNRIIQDNFGKTQMGRDLLAQDYILKQITSSLIYPESQLGKKFWDKIYERASQEYGTTNIPVNTFNKVWIIPDQAAVYESGNTVYVLRNHLKVMLEQDYLSLEKNSSSVVSLQKAAHTDTSTLGSQIIRSIILPELEREVNEGKNFANLRQIYSGMILATWYKHALKESFLGKIYANQAKVKGVDQEDVKTNKEIYQQYLKAFKKGVFNYIKDDVDQYSKQVIPRKYFSGGVVDFAGITRDATQGFKDKAVVVMTSKDMASISNEMRAQFDPAVLSKNIDRASVALENPQVIREDKTPKQEKPSKWRRFMKYTSSLVFTITAAVVVSSGYRISSDYNRLNRDVSLFQEYVNVDPDREIDDFLEAQEKKGSFNLTDQQRQEVKDVMVRASQLAREGKDAEFWDLVMSVKDNPSWLIVEEKIIKQRAAAFKLINDGFKELEESGPTIGGGLVLLDEGDFPEGMMVPEMPSLSDADLVDRLPLTGFKYIPESKIRGDSEKLVSLGRNARYQVIRDAYLEESGEPLQDAWDSLKDYEFSDSIEEVGRLGSMTWSLLRSASRTDYGIGLQKAILAIVSLILVRRLIHRGYDFRDWAKKRGYIKKKENLLNKNETSKRTREEILRDGLTPQDKEGDNAMNSNVGQSSPEKKTNTINKSRTLLMPLINNKYSATIASAVIVSVCGWGFWQDYTLRSKVKSIPTYNFEQTALAEQVKEIQRFNLETGVGFDGVRIYSSPGKFSEAWANRDKTVTDFSIWDIAIKANQLAFDGQYSQAEALIQSKIVNYKDTTRSYKVLDECLRKVRQAQRMNSIASGQYVIKNLQDQNLRGLVLFSFPGLSTIEEGRYEYLVSEKLVKPEVYLRFLNKVKEFKGREMSEAVALAFLSFSIMVLGIYSLDELRLYLKRTAGNKSKKESKFTSGDNAMKGGIDLNSDNLNLQIKRDGRGVPLPLAQQDLAQLSNIQGFVPVIIEIKPAINLPILSELQQELHLA